MPKSCWLSFNGFSINQLWKLALQHACFYVVELMHLIRAYFQTFKDSYIFFVFLSIKSGSTSRFCLCTPNYILHASNHADCGTGSSKNMTRWYIRNVPESLSKPSIPWKSECVSEGKIKNKARSQEPTS